MLITSSEQARVYIEGHASRTGPEEENIRLSEYRAAVAWDWLREEGGVPQERFLSDEDGPNIVGVGSAYPSGECERGS
jgi:outer membrane protein OmpA-like peptidoglycan-associated protein